MLKLSHLLSSSAVSILALSLVASDTVLPSPVTDLPHRDAELNSPTLLGYVHQRLYVLEERSSRVFILDAAGRRVGVFAGMGGQEGQLFHPAAMAVSDKQVAFFDQSNGRVEYFSLDGIYESQFRLPRRLQSRSVALDNRGNIYMNDPHMGSLVQVYDKSGTLIRSFGELTTTSQLYGVANKSKDAEQRAAANTVKMTIGRTGELYVVFMIAPIVRKYSPEGKLLFQTRLSGPVGVTLEHMFWNYKVTSGGMSSSVDTAQVPYITKAIALNQKQDRIYVLAAYDLFHKNSMLTFSTSGEQLAAIPFVSEQQNGLLYGMCVGDDYVYLTTIFHPGIYRISASL